LKINGFKNRKDFEKSRGFCRFVVYETAMSYKIKTPTEAGVQDLISFGI